MNNIIKLTLISFFALNAQALLYGELHKEITIKDKKFVEYISEDQIKQRVKEMGNDISNDIAQQRSNDPTSKPPLFVGVLNGSVIFLADLIREISCNCEIDFLKISSYGDATSSSGTITLHKNLNTSVTGRNVIIVEDIIDTGLSIKFVRELMWQGNPKSVKIASLLFKPESAKIDFPIDYIGFQVPPHFLIGYGIDYAQHGRNFKSIYTLAAQ